MASEVYASGCGDVFGGSPDLDTADLRLLLVKPTYTFNAAHAVVADVVAHELTVSGYARQTLAGKVLYKTLVAGSAVLDASDVTFAGLTAGESIAAAILFRHTGTDASAPLLAKYDLPGLPSGIASVTVQWAAPAAGGVLMGKNT